VTKTTTSHTTSTDVDLLIIGARISGIGAASHLTTRRPGTSFVILEGRDALGGTWDQFRYPDVRSDSDICEYFCRLLDHMEAHGYDTVQPVLDDSAVARVPSMCPNYVLRGIGQFPRAGTSGPWTVEIAYERDVQRLREGPVEDSALRFTGGGPVRSGSQPRQGATR
jgi:hypothetical protein